MFLLALLDVSRLSTCFWTLGTYLLERNATGNLTRLYDVTYTYSMYVVKIIVVPFAQRVFSHYYLYFSDNLINFFT